MKKLSETYKELGIAFSFPIEIRDANGNVTYYEHFSGFWVRWEYDANGNRTYDEHRRGWQKWERDAKGNETYYENSRGYWYRYERNANGEWTYYENSRGRRIGTPRSAKTCEGKVMELDGIKYKLTAL